MISPMDKVVLLDHLTNDFKAIVAAVIAAGYLDPDKGMTAEDMFNWAKFLTLEQEKFLKKQEQIVAKKLEELKELRNETDLKEPK